MVKSLTISKLVWYGFADPTNMRYVMCLQEAANETCCTPIRSRDPVLLSLLIRLCDLYFDTTENKLKILHVPQKLTLWNAFFDLSHVTMNLYPVNVWWTNVYSPLMHLWTNHCATIAHMNAQILLFQIKFHHLPRKQIYFDAF